MQGQYSLQYSLHGQVREKCLQTTPFPQYPQYISTKCWSSTFLLQQLLAVSPIQKEDTHYKMPPPNKKKSTSAEYQLQCQCDVMLGQFHVKHTKQGIHPHSLESTASSFKLSLLTKHSTSPLLSLQNGEAQT